jgi:transposase
MRGDDNQQEGMFSYVSPEKRVPADHPLRPIRRMVDEILKEMSPQFQKLYSEVGRPSIAPERLFRSLLLQIFYSVRSERLLIEQLRYNLLFRWFVGMEMDEAVWNHAVYSKNRERLLNEEVAESFFQWVLERARPFMSDEHFTVDGTLIEAWASQKSFRPKDGTGKPPGAGGEVDFKGEKRKNQTHESTTDPDARLWTKSRGSEAKLSYMGHVMMENRNGLLLQTFLSEANGGARCCAADGRGRPAGKASDVGRRQELRHARIRTRTARDEHHPARGAEHEQSQERGRRADHTACRVRGESAKAQTSGAVVRVDQDGRDAKESEVARDRQGGMAVYFHRGRLQPVPIAKPDGHDVTPGFDEPTR